MRRTVVAVASILSMLGLTGCAKPKQAWPPSEPIQWTVKYDADTLPGKAYPYWRGWPGPNTSRELEDGVLRIVDGDSKKGTLHCYSQAWFADPQHGAVFEARVKVIANDDRSGVALVGADGKHEVGITLYPDRVDVGRPPVSYAMSTTDDFHVYRLAIRNDDYHLWIDGKLAVEGVGKHTHEAHRGRNVIMFGSISSKARSEALWDYVRYVVLDRKPAPPRLAGARDVVIYKKEGIYACFPSLTMDDDGVLYTSFGTRVRRSHIDPTGGSARYVSRDGGETWQPFKGKTPLSSSWRCKDGSLANARAYGWRHVPESRREEFAKQGITVRQVKPGVVAYLRGAYARRSSDGGKTWQKQEIELPPHRSLMCFNASSTCRTKSGVLLNAVYGQLKEDPVGRSFVLRSEDNGKTWAFLPQAADPEGKVRLNETALVENGRGEIISMSRSEPPAGGHLFHAISKDQGKTWSTARRTKIWGYPANLLQLKDGRILCTYGYRRPPQGVRAVLSSDGGHTWDLDHIIVLRNDHFGSGGDLGYPISVELSPGKILTIYYITLKDGITHIAGTHWEVPKR